jgi:hypothetical protein
MAGLLVIRVRAANPDSMQTTEREKGIGGDVSQPGFQALRARTMIV